MTTPSALPASVLIDGVRYVPEDPSTIPNRASVCYMHDNHTFTRLVGGLATILREAEHLGRESPGGMLCPVTLLHGEKEIRRLKQSVHSRKGLGDTSKWEAEVRGDADALRLIEADRALLPRHCSNCRFNIREDNGYSNYTVEGTDIDCLKKLNPQSPVDAGYGLCAAGSFAGACSSFEEGEGVAVDVDKENGALENYSDDPELKELLRARELS